MNKEVIREIKTVIVPTVITIMVFACAFIGWLHSNMYQTEKETFKSQTQEILKETYYWDMYNFPPEVREEWMKKHSITDDDINPEKMLEKFIERQNHEID